MALLAGGAWELGTADLELPQVLADLPYGDLPANTAGVWDAIEATQGNYPGTVVPRSFNLRTAGGKQIWVHPNATEHIYQDVYMSRTLKNVMDKQTRDLAAQAELWSLHRAVSAATRLGITYDKPIVTDGWELVFSRPRAVGMNPVLKHAQPYYR
jgi:filamentous hemagglutinin